MNKVEESRSGVKKLGKLLPAEECTMVGKYINNDVINDAFAKIVNEVMAKEEQTWKTKIQLVDLANKDLVEMIQMRKAKKLQQEEETRQVTKYILNDVINAAVAQKVNQDIA